MTKETDKDIIAKQKKQIEFLQAKCRQAGVAILDQEVQIGGLKKTSIDLLKRIATLESCMTRNKKHIKGDQAELIAQEFFIKKGYGVFKNISAQGPVDMVVLDNNGYSLLIDVKAISLRSKNGWKVNRVPSEEQERLGVHLVYVNLDTREVLDEMPSKRKNKNNVVDIREWKKL